jgi:hypothetical protein
MIRVVFDKVPGGPDSPAEFVEVEDGSGKSVKIDWVYRSDGLVELQFYDLRYPDLSSDEFSLARRWISHLEILLEEAGVKK